MSSSIYYTPILTFVTLAWFIPQFNSCPSFALPGSFVRKAKRTVALLRNSVLLPIANSHGYNQVFVQPDLLTQSVLLLASHDFRINCDQQCVSIKKSSCLGSVVSMCLFSLLGPPLVNVSKQSCNKATFF